jgi:hypothetical protein
VVSGIFSTKQDAAAACALPYHMESMFIFVSFRGISQAVSEDDRGAKSSRKNADGKKHIFMIGAQLIPNPATTRCYRDYRASGPCSDSNSAISSLKVGHNPYVRVH